VVTTYYNYNRERIELETGTMDLNAGVAAPAVNTLATVISLSETEVSSDSILSH